MEEVKLNLMLIGITGHGKSATGNTLLNNKLFKVSNNIVSQTKEAQFSFTRFENKVLLMVDGPGMEDTELTKAEDRETIAKTMSEALAMCYGGVDAFLFVTKFGIKFTDQETSALEDFKKILGDNFMERMIVVMTHGDLFWSTMEDESPNTSFEKWCEEQRGTFQKLCRECEGRVVLFNNREKDDDKKQAQIRQVVQIAESLQNRFGRYTSTCFQIAEYEREKMILTYNAPHLREAIQEKLGLLTADIHDLKRNPSEEAKSRIRESVEKLKQEIEKYDKGYGVLEHLLDLAKKVESNLDDVEEITRLVEEIEDLRRAQSAWGLLGAVCKVVGAGFALVTHPITLTVGIVATVVTAFSGYKQLSLQSDIDKLELNKDNLERKIKNEPLEEEGGSITNTHKKRCVLQ